MAPKGVNQKVKAANDKKAQHEAQVKAKEAAEREKQAGKEWSQGANLRASQKANEAAAKADEAARKRREKAELLAEEEGNLSAVGKPKKTPVLSKKGKNKKKDDLSLLEDALVGAADKKAKAKRQAERQKEEALKKQQQEKSIREKEEEKQIDPLLANTDSMIAGTQDDQVGRAANKAMGVDGAGSGIDAALGNLNVGGAPVVNSRKALYKAFEERQMVQLKEESPGLKMSQYKDRIFQAWKKSPENPDNQAK